MYKLHKAALLTLTAMVTVPAFAQMPLPLMDNDRVNTVIQWQKSGAMIQAALECVQPPDAEQVRLMRDMHEIIPPRGFTVYEMPVQQITVSAGTYSADLAVPLPVAEQILENKKTTGHFTVTAGDKPSLSHIRCEW